MGKKTYNWLKINLSKVQLKFNLRKQSFQCPKCGGDLFLETTSEVMDGNSLYHCNNDEHTFFTNRRTSQDRTELFENCEKEPSFIDFDFHKIWYLDTSGNWVCEDVEK